MKIFYNTPVTKRRDFYAPDKKEYDFAEIIKTISKGILNRFNDAEITYPREIAFDESYIPLDKLKQFDICLCDTTTSNPSISYLAGKVEGIGIPVIYFASSEHGVLATASHNRHLLYSEASIDNEFVDELNGIIEEAKKSPNQFNSLATKPKPKPKAFISYSHNDLAYLKRLMVHLKPLERQGLIDVWQDTKIKTGDKWEEKITTALTEANIAILLISADFMASDFIVENELPPLLSKAEVKGTKILPVILSHCRFSREKSLSRFQAANSPSEPLSISNESEREAIYDKIASDIEAALK